MFRALGLQSAGGCAHACPDSQAHARAAKIAVFFTTSPFDGAIGAARRLTARRDGGKARRAGRRFAQPASVCACRLNVKRRPAISISRCPHCVNRLHSCRITRMSQASRQPPMRDLAGRFRLRAFPAADVWHAHGTLALHAVGPRTTVTVALEARGLRPGDVAGLSLFTRPDAWLGIERGPQGFALAQFDERTGHKTRVPLGTPSIFLRADCNLEGKVADFQYSTDG